MSINHRLLKIIDNIPSNVSLVAVSKTKSSDQIRQAYDAGQRIFGENKVQELVEKAALLPNNIQWHMIGHLQTNKVKYIAPFVSLIQTVDSKKLMLEINKRAQQNNRTICCLLQLKVAKEDSKYGLSKDELFYLNSMPLPHVKIVGIMGMATNTNNILEIQSEFKYLKSVFDQLNTINPQITILSMGMSGDYEIAIDQGSNMIRLGSSIFGKRATL